MSERWHVVVGPAEVWDFFGVNRVSVPAGKFVVVETLSVGGGKKGHCFDESLGFCNTLEETKQLIAKLEERSEKTLAEMHDAQCEAEAPYPKG